MVNLDSQTDFVSVIPNKLSCGKVLIGVLEQQRRTPVGILTGAF